jgi:hypothetical protein
MIRCLYKQANKVRGQLNKWKNPYGKYIDSGLGSSMVYFTRQDITFSVYLLENRFFADILYGGGSHEELISNGGRF